LQRAERVASSKESAEFIAVDWGTSSFRAYLIGAGGAIVDRIESARGVQSIGAGEHEPLLFTLLSPWRRANEAPPILMSGMIGSRQGWVEAPYIRCPAGLTETAAAIVTIQSNPLGAIGVVPGVVADESSLGPDVMRGEETQIFGALAASGRGDGLFVLPGTHSKWARVEAGRIVSFKTYMTGDVFAALRDHTILSRLMDVRQDDAEGFARGVGAARTLTAPGDLLHAIFMTRTLGLFERLRSDQLAEYLSGLLVGAEIIAAAPSCGPAPTIIGSPALTRRYRQAGELLGVTFDAAPDGCVALGQRELFAKWRGPLSAD
jgi:2-dehydro-3-deoxygalactonokinase